MSTFFVSPKELERQAANSFDGRTVSVMLCNNGSGLTDLSTTAAWIATEVSGNGYARYTTTLSTATYNEAGRYYQYDAFVAEFSCSGPSSIVANSVVLFLDGEPYVYAIAAEVPSLTLLPGKSKSYSVSIRLDT